MSVTAAQSREAFERFNEAVREIGRLDPDWALSYLGGATLALRAYLRALRQSQRHGASDER